MLNLLVFIFMMAIAFFCIDDKVWWASSKFDQEAWKSTTEKKRYIYVKDLLRRDLLIGKSEEEVIDMLGQSESAPGAPSSAQYLIKVGGPGLSQIYVLDLRFTNGKVSRAFVRGD